MSKDVFGVKLIYKYIVHSKDPQVLYEEQVLKINADSFDDAYNKAESFAESYIDKYTNINGDAVDISLYKTADCFRCYDEGEEITEVYSGFFKSDDDVLKTITTPLEANELLILRHK